jgi:hypothetical protein
VWITGFFSIGGFSPSTKQYASNNKISDPSFLIFVE